MYSNYKPSCCCSNDLSYLDSCSDIPTPSHFPRTYCCCSICSHRNKIVKKLTKPLLTVPKMKSSNQTFSSKNASKAKKKSPKTKKVSLDSLQSQDNKDENIDTKFASVRSSLSQTFLKKRTESHRTSNSSLINSDSFYKYKSSSKQLDDINEKQSMDLKLFLNKGRREGSPGATYSLLNRNPDSRQQQDDQNQSASYDPSRLQSSSSKALRKREKNYYPNDTEKHNDHIMVTDADPFKFYCFCSNKDPPAYIDPINLSKHSNASSKSSPQLDVICEEDIEVEDIRKMCGSRGGHPEAKASPSSTKVKKQKKLEDSCTEFLSIVCDNILESVQKSVDGKLKEFSKEASDKIDVLGEKLAKNEAAIKDLCSEVIEKMSEQNKKNFDVFYSRVQNLVENPNSMNRNVTQDKERQIKQSVLAPSRSMGSSYLSDMKSFGVEPTPTESEQLKKQQSEFSAPATMDSLHRNETKSLGNETTPTDADQLKQQHQSQLELAATWSKTPATQSRIMKSTTQSDVELLQRQQQPQQQEQPVLPVSSTMDSLYQKDTNIPATQPIIANQETPTDVDLHCRQPLLAEEESYIPKEINLSKIFSNTTQNTTHDSCNFDNIRTDIKCSCDRCCSDSNDEDEFDHTCCPKETKNITLTHPCENERETGGCIDSQGKNCLPKKEEIKIHGLPLKTTVTDLAKDLSMQDMKLQCEPISHQESCTEKRSPSPTTITTFNLTPGKMIFNCTCGTHDQDGESGEIEADGSKALNDRSLDIKLNCLNRCDNCDTSGYATEPEDNNEGMFSNSVRRRLLKKVSKIPCLCQDSGQNILEQDKTIENSSSQTMTRSSGKSSKSYSSSSRLFRL